MVSLLIDRGADIDKADSLGETPLFVAASVSADGLLLEFVCSDLKNEIQRGYVDIVCTLLRAGANPSIASTVSGTAREVAERRGHVKVLLAIDRHICRNSLVELCVGMRTAEFPVLVVLEIHNCLCKLHGLHEAELGEQKEWQALADGHLKDSVSWEIAKKVKHYLD